MPSLAPSEPALTLPTEPLELRLVVTDLDGTLLDAAGELPARFWALVDRLRERKITLAPASGRQYPMLTRMFGTPEGMAFIAENGTYVVRDGNELSSSPLDRDWAARVVRSIRALGDTRDLGVVWCGRDCAYIDRVDDAFVAEVSRYFASLQVVDDVLAVADDPIKLSVFDFAGSAETAEALAGWCRPHQVVISSQCWLDVMKQGVNKGAALGELQRVLGVTPEQTVVFGDYLNDLEMIESVPHSFAVANAHPSVLRAASYVAPTNAEQGVMQVLERLLDAADRAA
ncbi:HAD family hydrolase [Micropruina sonneratiae]|uniref:HAD family hydrolase n=1 Tax=Micropruina sonneratiae TaxID=2986940 RepID=UPI0022268011|nr:Cof-type HAD-IIB family hydrolase [Micropruina sp. KQZ13P-5]MCW3158512.1 Cof-type HAD-IIB family hydrolase [Micropruina sp. KQZ13P-5]